ncbi:MAG TPA: alanine--tRNA ligase, partial [Candidatus Acidoferrum sp.]|nr:alanine--tRNA ligase [Candidatus Acidoferrum sp.]
QKCVRAGGKHNDLENVGFTNRHHTFFEMLGNFSFGDYFKQDAIKFAWEFLTVRLRIPKEKLWVTVFRDDDEAADIWIKQMGVPAERVTRMGEKSNFWAMGDTGPCGPCTEIFYDHGPEVAGGPPGSPDEDGDRYIEIWNLVFMQFNRSADGSMTKLPKPSVDTGMGLERIAAVMQHVHSNYEIDLFQSLIKAAAAVTGAKDANSTSLRVIADHIRSCAFLVADGVLPSNEGRGYVLRRIIRRAIRHGHHLGMKQPFFHKLVAPLAQVMGDAYPDLVKQQQRVADALLAEEQQFDRTLDNGMTILDSAIAALKGKVIPGEVVFKLYDTYGFPVDLTADIAREKGLTLDMAGFDAAMNVQKQQARAASKFEAQEALAVGDAGETVFQGYDILAAEAPVLALYQDGKTVDKLTAGQSGVVLLANTPFYAESGGQVGDIGVLVAGASRFMVEDTRKQGNYHLHYGRLEQGSLGKGDKVRAEVSVAQRQATMLNHSATHLMHAALRQVLGDHVTQKGSLVNATHLRFDFSHNKPLTDAEIAEIENLVNAQILANAAVCKEVMSIDAARKLGAMMLFGEKYGSEVRVVSMGGAGKDAFSLELCGGTHVQRTGDIGSFRIVQESGIAAGVRRIEAVTGLNALAHTRDADRKLEQIAALVKGSSANVLEKIQQALVDAKALEKEIQQLKAKLAAAAGDELLAKAEELKGAKVLVAQVEGMDSKTVRDTAEQLKNKLGSGVIVLVTAEGGKASIVAAVTADLTARLKAGDLVNKLAIHVGGKGGGRPDLAMAGGPEAAGIVKVLTAAKELVATSL